MSGARSQSVGAGLETVREGFRRERHKDRLIGQLPPAALRLETKVDTSARSGRLERPAAFGAVRCSRLDCTHHKREKQRI